MTEAFVILSDSEESRPGSSVPQDPSLRVAALRMTGRVGRKWRVGAIDPSFAPEQRGRMSQGMSQFAANALRAEEMLMARFWPLASAAASIDFAKLTFAGPLRHARPTKKCCVPVVLSRTKLTAHLKLIIMTERYFRSRQLLQVEAIMRAPITITTVLFCFFISRVPAQEKDNNSEAKTEAKNAKAMQAKEKARAGATVYDDFEEPWREKFIKAWENEVESTKQSVKTYQQRSRVARSLNDKQNNIKQMKAAKEKLKTLEKNDPPFLYGGCQWGCAEWKVGHYGPTSEFFIFQVIDDRHLLLGYESTGPAFILQMDSTAGLVDGKVLDLRGSFVHVTGTKTYTTVLGSSKSVLAVEIIDVESLKKKD